MEDIGDLNNYSSNYSSSKLWSKITSLVGKVSSKVILAVLQLYYVLEDGKVDLRSKGLIIGGLGYFILPLDLIPDAILPVGYGDDLAVLLYVISLIKKNITPETKEKALQKMKDLGFSDIEPMSL